jgi:Zn-dependent M28 family amino/carboxypeptidase
MDNLTVLCDDFGSRFGGTEGERMAADFMKAKMDEYGLKRTWLEPVDYIGWRRGEASFEIVKPVSKPVSCITLPHSPPTDLEGQVVDMGAGSPEAFDRRAGEIAGKIVLTNSEVNPDGVKRWIHRNEKYSRSLLAGAIGFIFVNHYPGYGPATGGIGRNDQAPIPGFSISMEDGAFIQRLIKRKGDVRIRLKSSDRCEPMTSWNVIGDLPGESSSETMVMAGCHYDGHDISQGAGDPASGAVALLEAARVLAKHGGTLPVTMRFVLWGVEEIGLLGSREYVRTHRDELDNIRFYLNMDAAGSIKNKGIALNEWQELQPVLEKWSQEMALDFKVNQSVSAHSDHFPFMMEGVPTGGIRNVGGMRGGRGYGHTRYDTLDKLSLKGLREAAALSARLLLRMATAEAWPASRRSEDDVLAVLDSPEYREEAEFRVKVAEFYKKLA